MAKSTEEGLCAISQWYMSERKTTGEKKALTSQWVLASMRCAKYRIEKNISLHCHTNLQTSVTRKDTGFPMTLRVGIFKKISFKYHRTLTMRKVV